MKRKNFGIGLLLLTTMVVLTGIPGAMAQSQYATALQTDYGISSCSTCHVDFNSPPTLTTYGNLFSSVSTHSSDPSGALCSIGAPPGATTNNCPKPSDTTPPVITLAGSNPVTLTVGTSYTDAGATAVDAVDGNVAVTTTGSVNTNLVGTYTITYTAKDKTGNTATATRTVNVVAAKDTTPPVITLAGSNPVTITVGTSYTDAGATAVDAVDGNVAVTTTGSVNTNVVGAYTITYTAADKSGNTATATRMVNVVTSSPTTPPSTDHEDEHEYDHEHEEEHD